MNKSEMIGCIKGETLAHWNLLQATKAHFECGYCSEEDVNRVRTRWVVLDDLCQSLGIGCTSKFLCERRCSELPFE